ncbi:unnamed protein product, partial [Scytosiphon promiscuus]
GARCRGRSSNRPSAGVWTTSLLQLRPCFHVSLACSYKLGTTRSLSRMTSAQSRTTSAQS